MGYIIVILSLKYGHCYNDLLKKVEKKNGFGKKVKNGKNDFHCVREKHSKSL